MENRWHTWHHQRMYAAICTVWAWCFAACTVAHAVTYRDNEHPLPASFEEAPMLAERVAAGTLPPVAERLPERPVVVGPGTLITPEHLDWTPGRYGGKLVGCTSSPVNEPDVRDACMVHILNTPKMQRSPITGNLADQVVVNDDNTVFTIRLRQGLRWSDGHPVTTEDVRFAYEDVLTNEKIMPILDRQYHHGGMPDADPLDLKILDTQTFQVTSTVPYGGFLAVLGAGQRWGGSYMLIKPAHYLKQFHLKYTSLEAMRGELDRASLGDQWWRLYLQKDAWFEKGILDDAIGYPTLSPWMRVEGPNDRIVMERNPFYFKVDTEGRQLPYIDRYESLIVADVEMIPMKVITEEVNLLRVRCTPDKLPVYKQYERERRYTVVTSLKMHNAPLALFLNLTHPDEAWREVVRDLRFRRAVNTAMDREQILEVFYFGQGKPSRWVPSVHDLEAAKRLLDDMGMKDLDGDGWRETPRGERFILPLVIAPNTSSWVGITEFIADRCRDIGLKTTTKTISQTLILQRSIANRLYGTLDWLDTPNWDQLLVYDYLPDQRVGYGKAWGLWMTTQGRKGEEPPPWVKDIYRIFVRVLSVRPDSTESDQLASEMMTWMHANIPTFPLGSEIINPMIVPDNLGNLAHSGLGSAAQFAADQFYFLPEDQE